MSPRRPDPNPAAWIAIGTLGALALAFVLIPLRTVTSASNLAFVFLVLTIVVAEVGGRAAALATAVMAALGLNFFLTAPYLTLAIDKPDDVVAFVALAVSGLIAAAFGRRRARSSALAGHARHDIEALGRAAEGLTRGTPLAVVLEDLRRVFRLEGLVLRHGDGRLAGAAPPGHGSLAAPRVELEPRVLGADDDDRPRLGLYGLRLPEGGGRLRLGAEPASPSLDLWEGDEAGLGVDDRRALAVAAAMLGLALRDRAG